jgi:hypothetical protein
MMGLFERVFAVALAVLSGAPARVALFSLSRGMQVARYALLWASVLVVGCSSTDGNVTNGSLDCDIPPHPTIELPIGCYEDLDACPAEYAEEADEPWRAGCGRTYMCPDQTGIARCVRGYDCGCVAHYEANCDDADTPLQCAE